MVLWRCGSFFLMPILGTPEIIHKLLEHNPKAVIN